jgi:hypothetical protein
MTAIIERLGQIGAHYRDPIVALDFSAADMSLPWLPYDLLSVGGLPIAGELSEAQRRRFSQIEFARLCAAGLWLEGLLISRLTRNGFIAARADETRVILQEVREESGHSLMFLEMIDRAGLAGVELLGPTRLLTWVAHRLDPAGAEFWAMVYIGESVTNTFVQRALRLAADGAPICRLARDVMALHHRDEACHIAAAHAFLKTRIATMGRARRRAFAVLLGFLLERFLTATLYPTGASLASLGIADPERIARTARACPARRRLAHACAEPSLALIRDAGLASSRQSSGWE